VEEPIRFPVEAPGGFRAVLKFTAFRNIWFAQLAAQLADKFLLFSLIILSYNVSGGSTPVAITLLTYTVPAVVLAPPAGVLADRVNRKQLMMWCNFGRAAAIALIPIAALVPGLRNDFAHLLLITFVFSAVGQLFGPAEAAVIPTILPRSALITANSMSLLTMVLTLVVGGALVSGSSLCVEDDQGTRVALNSAIHIHVAQGRTSITVVEGAVHLHRIARAQTQETLTQSQRITVVNGRVQQRISVPRTEIDVLRQRFLVPGQRMPPVGPSPQIIR